MRKVQSLPKLLAILAAMTCATNVCVYAAEENEIRVSVKLEQLPTIRVSGPIALPPGSSGPALLFTELSNGAPRRIRASQGDRELAVEMKSASKPGGRESFACFLPAGTSGAVQFEYDVDPTFYPPGSEQETQADARARVTTELGVLRATTILPQALLRNATRLRFDLPDGWTAVTPWPERDGTFLLEDQSKSAAPEYIGIGPFVVTGHTLDGITYRFGVCGANDRIDAPALLRIVTKARDVAGRAPGVPGDVFSVVVVPRDFVRGGSAGRRSAVQPPNPVVLAHEMFHWWDHSRLTRQEANWFHEGFTEYYGIRLARDAGLIDEQFEQACFADLNAEMRYLETDSARSLADASRAAPKDPKAARIVYAKGALLALLMERRLEPSGRSLDEIMSHVLALGRSGLGNEELRQHFHDVYKGALDTEFDRYVLETNALPDLGLPSATGATGAARYLPNNK